MIHLLIIITVATLYCSGCATRVLVKDCESAGPDIYNCELVKDL